MPQRFARLFLIAILHAVVVYFLVQERPPVTPEQPIRYSRLLVSIPRPEPAARRPEILPQQDRPRPSIKPAAPQEITASAEPVPLKISPQPTTSEPPIDPFDHSAKVNAGEKLDIGVLVKQAGKADRETRPANENRHYRPAADSMEAVLTRAFTAAKLAVPPKWFEAALIEPITPPGARKPIYQVKTAFGTYCLYYPDRITGGTGPPQIASCPVSFGR